MCEPSWAPSRLSAICLKSAAVIPVAFFRDAIRPPLFLLEARSGWDGLDIPACFTSAKRFAVVELGRNLSQIVQEISGTSRQLIQLSIALLAIPGIAFRFIDTPDSLDHQTNGVRRPLRRMRSIGREHKDVSFPDRLAL